MKSFEDIALEYFICLIIVFAIIWLIAKFA